MKFSKSLMLCLALGSIGCGPAVAPTPPPKPPAEQAKQHEQHSQQSQQTENQ